MSFGAMAAGALPLYGIGALGPVLIERLEVTRAEVGALPATLFGVAALSSVLLGRLADGRGARRTMSIALAAGVTLAATGVATERMLQGFYVGTASSPTVFGAIVDRTSRFTSGPEPDSTSWRYSFSAL